MTSFITYLHRVTGLDMAIVATLSAHFRKRLAFLGLIMLGVAFNNGALLIVSLTLNGYTFIQCVAAGVVVALVTYSIERVIVTTIGPLTLISFTFRALLFFAIVGTHLVFVDLAFYRFDLIPVAKEAHQLKKDAAVSRLDTAIYNAKQQLTFDKTAVEDLEAVLLKKMNAPLLETQGLEGTGKIGMGGATLLAEAKYQEFKNDYYPGKKAELSQAVDSSTAVLTALQDSVAAIQAQPFDYNAIGLTTKLNYLYNFAYQPGNSPVRWLMILFFCLLVTVEFTPLYARYVLEISEYTDAYHHDLSVQKATAAENEATAAFANRLRGEAKRTAATTAQAANLARLQAEDRFDFAVTQIDFIKRAEAGRADALAGRSPENQQRVHRVFDELIEDILNIFRTARTSS